MPRKAWSDLTPGYRARLERSGVTEASHSRGVPIKAAQHNAYMDLVNAYSPDFERMYGRTSRDNPRPGRPWNAPNIADVLKNLSPAKGRAFIKEQLAAQRYYDRGELAKAQRKWQQRDRSLPEWMYFYHGAFSGE